MVSNFYRKCGTLVNSKNNRRDILEHKKSKKIMIWMIICVIVIIILLMLLVVSNRKGKQEQQKSQEQEQIQEEKKEKEIKIGDDYFMVVNCVNQYLAMINPNNSMYYSYDEENNYVQIIEDEEIRQDALSVLSDLFIKEKNISINNVYDFVTEMEEEVIYVPLEMKAYPGEKANSYVIYGYMQDYEYHFVEDLYLVINLDRKNKTFSVVPINKEEYQEEKKGYDEEIEKNRNNQIIEDNITTKYKLQQYFNYYKWMMLSNPEEAYQRLEKTYREKRFESKENFMKYVEENRENLIGKNLKAYKETIYEEEIEYVEKDQQDKYYIFNVSKNNATDFTVMLDNYVIGTKETLEEYRKGTSEEKVSINVMRFISSLNDKNYDYIYRVLAKSFQQNYFETQEKFEEFAEDIFFENNQIEEAKFSEQSGYYVYKLKISDGNGQTKNMDIIMQLQEGTDFVMSFSIEE